MALSAMLQFCIFLPFDTWELDYQFLTSLMEITLTEFKGFVSHVLELGKLAENKSPKGTTSTKLGEVQTKDKVRS